MFFLVEYGLQGRVALISGVNNVEGIGAACALALAGQGARLVLVYKRVPHAYAEANTGRPGMDRYFKANAGDAAGLEARLRQMGAEYLLLERDITDEEQVAGIYDAARRRFGPVEILVNNAAFADEDGADTITGLATATIDASFAVNVRGALLMTRAFVAQRTGWGRVVNLSTDAAQAFAGQICYGASKAALEALTRSLALETGPYGITVNCVAPGPTQTGYIGSELEAALLPHIPAGRLVLPRDIADAVLFLASDRASMITGQVIKVAGGHAV